MIEQLAKVVRYEEGHFGKFHRRVAVLELAPTGKKPPPVKAILIEAEDLEEVLPIGAMVTVSIEVSPAEEVAASAPMTKDQ